MRTLFLRRAAALLLALVCCLSVLSARAEERGESLPSRVFRVGKRAEMEVLTLTVTGSSAASTRAAHWLRSLSAGEPDSRTKSSSCASSLEKPLKFTT